MDLAFFGLREPPFNPTPDPRFLHLTPGHQEALAQLLYGVQKPKGFILLTGEVGTGKTTLLHALLEQLNETTAVPFVTNSFVDEAIRYLDDGKTPWPKRLGIVRRWRRIPLRCGVLGASTAAAGLAAFGVGHSEVLWSSLFGLARSARALLPL